MALLPNNSLVNVATFNDAKLAYLQNYNVFVSTLNTKYKMFNNETANLGDEIQIKLPDRAVASVGLVANFSGVQLRPIPLVCDQAANVAQAFTSQQFIFNVRDYMQDFGKDRTEELSADVEYNVGLNCISGVPVMTVNNEGQSVPTGALHTESGPFRFYGDGTTPINSFGQLAEMEALFRNFGAAPGPLKSYIDDIATVDIINSGLTQFVPSRNDEYASSWNLGSYKGSHASYFQTNFLPIHNAGTAGNNADTLTLVSTNDPTGQNITQLTFSGISVSAGAFKSGDLLQFDQSTGLVYLTFIGHKPSKNLVQVRVTADADATSGTATVSITPALQSTFGLNQNLNRALTAGMTASALPDHRAGMVVGGNAFYLAMPPLDDTEPYHSHTSSDPKTGVSLRNYYGTRFGQNQKGYITDCIWAALAVPEYTMRIVFPLHQSLSSARNLTMV